MEGYHNTDRNSSADILLIWGEVHRKKNCWEFKKKVKSLIYSHKVTEK